MVRVCYICKIYSHKPGAENLSFHGLPIGMEKRNLWLSVLGFDQEHQFPKKVEICSKHFDQSDYVYREDGSRYLKPYAAPLPIHSVFVSLDTESTGSESSITEISSTDKYVITEAELDEELAEKRYLKPDAAPLPIQSEFVDTESTESESTITAISSADEYAITIKAEELDDKPAEKSTGSESAIAAVSSADEYAITIKEEELYNNIRIPAEESNSRTSEAITACMPDSSTIEDSSSSTLSASEIEDVAIEITSDLTPKRRKKTIRYVGDLTSDDFSTPRKAIKNYRLMKTTVDKQRKKIRSLQTTVLKLRKRITKFQERFKTPQK